MKTKIATFIIATLMASVSLFSDSNAIKPEFVDMLLSPYFELQTALAKDDLATAKSSAETFEAMLGHGPSHEAAPSLSTLAQEAKSIIEATDIKSARETFHTLSKELTMVVEHVGTSGKTDVVQMRCPMAFNNQGATWLQNSTDLANPYYGSMMYKCGTVLNTLASAKGDHSGVKHSDHDHSGHNH